MSFKFNALTGGFNTFTQADLTSIGGSNDLSFLDSAKIKLGTGNDLQLYHDASNSYIENSTNALFIRSDSLQLYKQSASERYIVCAADAAVKSFYDNSLKFETTSGGAKWTGDLTCDDNNKIRIGSSGDLNLFHDGSHSYIENLTGGLYIKVGNGEFLNRGGNEVLAKFIENGNVELYYDNVKKAETTAHGFFVTGSLWADGLYLDDNEKLHLGTSGADLDIYHDGTDSLLVNSTGDFEIRGAGTGVGNVLLRPKTGENGVIVKPDNAVELYYDNAKKFETTSTGIEVTGRVTASTHVYLNDNGKFFSGDSQDLQMYHGGTHSYIYEAGGGNLVLRTAQGTYSSVVLQAGAENSVACYKNGAVDLFYDNVKKFETNSLGTIVTGQQRFTNTGVASSYIGADSDGGIFGTDTAGLVFKTGVTGGDASSSGTIRMKMNSNGKILINRTNEDGTGVIHIAVNSGGGISVRTAVQTSETMLDFGNQNGVVGSIKTSGTSTSFNTSSDYRLKENAVAISDGITRLKTLKPYRFNFKADNSTTLDGFFAHEVTAVPEAISGTKDAVDEDNNPIHQGIDQSKLVPLLVAAVQESISEIETLQTKVAALEAA